MLAAAYLMANPHPEMPTLGMIMNGEDYIFVKLDRQLSQYAISKKFTIVNPQQNELYDVVRVIKRLIDLDRNRSLS